MGWQASPFVLPLLVMAGLSFAATLYVLRRSSERGVWFFVAVTLGAAWYALCYALELASTGLDQKVFWARLMQTGTLSATTGLLGFAGLYTERPAWLRWRTHLLLAVEPAIAQTLIWTNDLHHWFWTRTSLQPYLGSFTRLEIERGPAFWMHIVYTYGVILVALIMLGQAFARASSLHRRQLFVLLLCSAVMALARVMVVAGWNPLAPVDPTPFLAGTVSVLGAWSLWRYRVLDLLPVARDRLLERMGEGMVVVNSGGYIVDANRAMLRLLGQEASQAIGRPASEILPFYDELDARHDNGVDLHEEIAWPTANALRYFDLQRSVLFDQQGSVGGHMFLLHDITERRRVEEQERERSQELTTLYDTALEVAAQLDVPRLLQAITERAVQLLHASMGELALYRPETDDLQSAALYGIPAEMKGRVLQRGEGLSGKILEKGAPLAVEDYRTWPGRASAYEGQPFGPVVGVPLKWGERLLGTIDVAREAGPPFTAQETRILSLFAAQASVAIENARLYADLQRELAQRALADEQLRQRTQELSTLYDTALEVASRLELAELLPIIVERAALLLRVAGCGMYLYDPVRERLQHVAAYGLPTHILGHSLQRGEGICGKVLDSGQPVMVEDYDHWPGRSEIAAKLVCGSALAVPVKWGERVLGVLDVQRGAGVAFGAEEIRLLTLFANQAAVALANAQLYEAARRELAERKNAEARLQQAQRMEAVGVLAGGVAHEFNNLLTIIQGNVELGMADLHADHVARESLATVVKTTQRAAILTHQLLAFSRRQQLTPQELDLNALVTTLARMLEPVLGPNVHVQLDIAPGISPVLADERGIEQVLMNLALNARDAMPEGGELHITTAAATLDEEFCRTRANIKPGEYVRLTVRDTGVGMDEAIQRRVFEPFFTTKDVGKGSGLGLSVVYGIIRQHEGLIEVQSEVGRGARFDVYLPVSQGQ